MRPRPRERRRHRCGGPARLDRSRPTGRHRARSAAGIGPREALPGGSREDVAASLLTLDAINFGSGWFPTLNKRAGCSGYYTVSWALADRFRENGPWSNEELRTLDADELADVLGQERGHELVRLYASALHHLGEWLGDRNALDVIGDSAEGLAESLREMPFFDDLGFWKRAQITANDLQLAG